MEILQVYLIGKCIENQFEYIFIWENNLVLLDRTNLQNLI